MAPRKSYTLKACGLNMALDCGLQTLEKPFNFSLRVVEPLPQVYFKDYMSQLG